jgi:hypothetical protein
MGTEHGPGAGRVTLAKGVFDLYLVTKPEFFRFAGEI